MLILNDPHIGAKRKAGATVESAMHLRAGLINQFRELISEGADDVMILGDLFDGYAIDQFDMMTTYMMFHQFLEGSDIRLHLVAGNHDLSKNSENISSFDFLCSMLRVLYGERVIVYRQPKMAAEGVYVIPHVTDQETFDKHIKDVLAMGDVKILLLHCNYDNHFAVDQDHSLNLDKVLAKMLVEKGITIGMAHEHHPRTELDGKVIIFGNQFPSSVADCKGRDEFACHEISNGEILVHLGYRASSVYATVNWRDELDDMNLSIDFIRVEGEASAEEASEVIRKVKSIRDHSIAFVVANAVEIAGHAMEEDALTMEEIENFNVLEELYANLKPKQIEAVKDLWAMYGGQV